MMIGSSSYSFTPLSSSSSATKEFGLYGGHRDGGGVLLDDSHNSGGSDDGFHNNVVVRQIDVLLLYESSNHEAGRSTGSGGNHRFHHSFDHNLGNRVFRKLLQRNQGWFHRLRQLPNPQSQSQKQIQIMYPLIRSMILAMQQSGSRFWECDIHTGHWRLMEEKRIFSTVRHAFFRDLQCDDDGKPSTDRPFPQTQQQQQSHCIMRASSSTEDHLSSESEEKMSFNHGASCITECDGHSSPCYPDRTYSYSYTHSNTDTCDFHPPTIHHGYTDDFSVHPNNLITGKCNATSSTHDPYSLLNRPDTPCLVGHDLILDESVTTYPSDCMNTTTCTPVSTSSPSLSPLAVKSLLPRASTPLDFFALSDFFGSVLDISIGDV